MFLTVVKFNKAGNGRGAGKDKERRDTRSNDYVKIMYYPIGEPQRGASGG